MVMVIARRTIAACASACYCSSLFNAIPRSVSAFRTSPTPPIFSVFPASQRVTLLPIVAMSGSASAATSAGAEDSTSIDVASNIAFVRRRMEDSRSSSEGAAKSVRLVAVSKTKPLELLKEAYEGGQRHFGENYAQELMTKVSEMPDDVAWHFIGPLQSNKAAALVKTVGLDQLACIETVSTIKLASKLNRAVESLNEEMEGGEKKLGIYIQVNTSGEESKSGVSPGAEATDFASQISSECPWLSIDGLMTIGAPGDDSCFDALIQCRSEVASVLGRDPSELELSMGMSGDFETDRKSVV